MQSDPASPRRCRFVRGFKNTRPALFAGPPTRPPTKLRSRNREKNSLAIEKPSPPRSPLHPPPSAPLLPFSPKPASPRAPLQPATVRKRAYTDRARSRGPEKPLGIVEITGRSYRATPYPALLGNNKLRQRWIAVTPIIIRGYRYLGGAIAAIAAKGDRELVLFPDNEIDRVPPDPRFTLRFASRACRRLDFQIYANFVPHRRPCSDQIA